MTPRELDELGDLPKPSYAHVLGQEELKIDHVFLMTFLRYDCSICDLFLKSRDRQVLIDDGALSNFFHKYISPEVSVRYEEYKCSLDAFSGKIYTVKEVKEFEKRGIYAQGIDFEKNRGWLNFWYSYGYSDKLNFPLLVITVVEKEYFYEPYLVQGFLVKNSQINFLYFLLEHFKSNVSDEERAKFQHGKVFDYNISPDMKKQQKALEEEMEKYKVGRKRKKDK